MNRSSMTIPGNKYMRKLIYSLVMTLTALIQGGVCVAEDTDGDGMSDQMEQTILETYRPWLYYDQGETVWPCSATWFVQHSRLIHDPCGDIPQTAMQAHPLLALQNATWLSGYRQS